METMPDSLHADLEQLWKQVYSAGALIKTFAEQLRASRDAVRKLESEVASLSAQLRSREEQLDSMREELDHIEELRTALSKAEGELQAAHVTIAQLQQHLTQVEQQHHDAERLQQQIERLRNELSTLQQQYAALTDDYRAAQETIASLSTFEEERANLRAKIAELEHEHLRSVAAKEELAYLHEQIEQLHQEREQLLELIQQQKHEIELLSKRSQEYEHLQRELDSANHTIASYQEKLTACEADIARLSEQLRQAESALSAATPDAQFARWKAEQEELLRSRELEYQRLQEQYQALEQQHARLREELESQHQLNAELERRVNDQRHHHPAQTADAREEELISLRRELELAERASAQRQEQLIELSDEIARLRKQLFEYQQNDKSIEQRIAEAISPLEIKLEAAERERKHLQVQLMSQRQRIHQLEDQIRIELERNIVLKRRIRQLEGQPPKAQIEHIIEQLDRIVESLRSQGDPSQQQAGMAQPVEEITALIERIEKVVSYHHRSIDDELLEAVKQSRALLEQQLKRSE